MARSRRSAIISGITLIVVGLLLFWLDREGLMGSETVFFVVGAVFLGAYLYGKNYGLLIPACIMLGLGMGRSLARVDLVERPVMVGLGTGFLAIYVIALLYEKRSHWWPLIPGCVLLINGFSSFESVIEFMFENWPLALVVVGIFILLGAFRGTKGRAEAP